MAAYFFASPIDVDIRLEAEETRKQVEMKGEKEKVISCPVYYDGDSVGGQVCHHRSLDRSWLVYQCFLCVVGIR
jgi:vacuolar protein sorting-associated protein 26